PLLPSRWHFGKRGKQEYETLLIQWQSVILREPVSSMANGKHLPQEEPCLFLLLLPSCFHKRYQFHAASHLLPADPGNYNWRQQQLRLFLFVPLRKWIPPYRRPALTRQPLLTDSFHKLFAWPAPLQKPG